MYGSIELKQVHFSSSTLTPVIQEIQLVGDYIPVLNTNTFIEISTPQEFLDIENHNGQAFVLTNDLDFSGITYEPLTVSNVFIDGNNHTIENISYVNLLSVGNDDSWNGYGIFEKAYESSVINLTFDNINFNLQVEADSSYQNHSNQNFGLLAGQTSQFRVENVSVINSSFIVNALLNETASINFGGLIGQASQSIISNNVSVEADLELDGLYESGEIGGLVGSAGSTSYSGFREIYTSGQIVATLPYGRISGVLGSVGFAKVENIYSTMNLDVNLTLEGYTNDVGGLIGYAYESDIMNVYTNQTMDIFSTDDTKYGALFGGLYLSNITNAYSFSVDSYSIVLPILTDNRAYDEYINTYGLITNQSSNILVASKLDILDIMSELFDATIWDFNDLTEPPTFQ